MASCVFPNNKVLKGMSYVAGVLSLDFIRPEGLERRSYSGVPLEKAYGLIYKKTGKDVLSYWRTEIRKQYDLIDKKLVR